MKKNDIVTLSITGMTSEGSGVGRLAETPDDSRGFAVFIPGTAIGDTVTARLISLKKAYAFGKIESILVPSPDRITPDCEAAARCGGCTFRHIRYEAECAVKQQRVADAFARVGHGEAVPLETLIPAPQTDFYRNKAQLPVRRENGQLKIGFYAPHSHRVVEHAHCRLHPPEFTALAGIFAQWMEKWGVSAYEEKSRTGLCRHLFLRKAEGTGEIMVCVVVNGGGLPHAEDLMGRLAEVDGVRSVLINKNKSDTNVVLGKECVTLYGNPAITDTLCGLRFRVSPLSFFQVNHVMAEKLYRLVAELAHPTGKTILDLYCGGGAIGLCLAGAATEVIGVEVAPAAVEDARFNARQNGIANASFFCEDAEAAAARLSAAGVQPDIVIVDPPRKGCTPGLIQIIAGAFAPPQIIYVSCDPATLARDVALLAGFDYRAEREVPLDMFPRTPHVETIVSLHRHDG